MLWGNLTICQMWGPLHDRETNTPIFKILYSKKQQQKKLTKVSQQCLPSSRERPVPFPGKANPENALHKGGHQIYPGFSL